MKELSLKAQAYILTVILIGIGLFIWSIIQIDPGEVWMTLVLSILASLSLIFKVTGTTERSHYNISFTIFAFSILLVGAPGTIIVILIAHLVEWVFGKYPWYIQSFNIAQYIIVSFLTSLFYYSLNPEQHLFTTLGVVSALIAMLVFTYFNHFLIGLVIWLARGENFFESGIFDPFALMLDFTLLIMGAGAAMLWTLNPLAILIIMIPQYLLYSTLRVPELERKSETDPKTDLYNARFFSQALETELQKAHREGSPLTIVMADLDLLREINNTYGHLGGDEVLIGIAHILKESLADEDIIARFGGEEFAVLFPGEEPEQIYERIEAIRKKIEVTDFQMPSSVTPIKATMSFGIANLTAKDQFANDIIHNADLALYHAKLSGRNMTCIYGEDSFHSLFEMISDDKNGNHQVQEMAPVKVPLDERVSAYTAPTPAKHLLQTSIEPPDEETAPNIEAQPTVEDQSKSKLWQVSGFIAGLCLLALILTFIQIQPGASIDWLALGLFVVLVILAEWLSINLYFRGTAVSTSAAPMLAGVLLFGPVGALALSLAFALTSKIKHHSPWNRLIFNFSNQLFAAMLYTTLIKITGNTFTGWDIIAQFAVCVVAAMIVYIFTTAGVAAAVYLDQRIPFKQFWMEQYSWLAPMYLAIGVCAFALTISYQTAYIIGIGVILVPLIILRFSQKQYLDHTRESVNKLKVTNLNLENQKQKISQLNEDLLQALSQVIDSRDPYVLGHANHVVEYAVMIAKRMNLAPERIENVRKAGLLHDIGKVGVRDSILFKPSSLTHSEFEIIQKHPLIGSEIIKNVRELQELVPIIRHHHERVDGCGYPEGLIGDAIPLEARIMALADAIDAMASIRPYKKARSPIEILDEIKRCKGTQFDPQVVDAFLAIIEEEGLTTIRNSTKGRTDELALYWSLAESEKVRQGP